MLSLKKQTYLLVAIAAALLPKPSIYSQATSDAALYNWFDTQTGIENRAIHNGIIHVNFDKTPDLANHRYYAADYQSGTVQYDGQPYYNAELKYDIYQDALLVLPPGYYDAVAIVAEKTQSFQMYGKDFVNLNYGNATVPEFIKGYYERNVIGKSFTFYIKHHKDLRKVIISDQSYIDFRRKNTFVLLYKDAYHGIGSKKSVTALFPEQKAQINDFYDLNRKLEKSDELQFMEKLFQYINIIAAKQ